MRLSGCCWFKLSFPFYTIRRYLANLKAGYRMSGVTGYRISERKSDYRTFFKKDWADSTKIHFLNSELSSCAIISDILCKLFCRFTNFFSTTKFLLKTCFFYLQRNCVKLLGSKWGSNVWIRIQIYLASQHYFQLHIWKQHWYRYLTWSRTECWGWGWMSGRRGMSHAPG